MTKQFHITMKGSKRELERFDIALKIIRDFNRIGVEPTKALEITGKLLVTPLPLQNKDS